MSQSSQIILTLKKTLKAKGLKYVDVAKHLYISESSIKWFTCDTALNDQEEAVKEGIRAIMQGNARSKDHSSDALHIFHAAKNEGYLLAVDNRIINKRDEISNYLFNEKFGTFKFMITRFIFTPTEFIEIYNMSQNFR